MTYEPHEVCNCNCHTMEGAHHVMACCHQCPHCGANITRGYEDEHEQRCEQERLSMDLPLNLYNSFVYMEIPSITVPRRADYHEQIQRDIDQEVLKEMWECIEKAEREKSPAVQFLRECQERERKLGK